MTLNNHPTTMHCGLRNIPIVLHDFTALTLFSAKQSNEALVFVVVEKKKEDDEGEKRKVAIEINAPTGFLCV